MENFFSSLKTERTRVIGGPSHQKKNAEGALSGVGQRRLLFPYPCELSP